MTAADPDRRPAGRLRPAVLRRALRLLLPYWPRLLGATVALLVTSGATLAVGQGLRVVIDGGLLAGDPSQLSDALLLFGAIIVLLTFGTFVRFYLVSWLGERVSADLRRAVFRHVVQLHPGWFDENRPSEIQSRLTADTAVLQTVIGSSASIALRNLLMAVGGVVLLVVTDARLAAYVLLGIPALLVPLLLFGRQVRRLSRTSQDRIADVGSFVAERLGQIKVVQAFGLERASADAFDGVVEAAFRIAVRRIARRALLITVVMLAVLLAIGAMLWAGGQQVLSGRSTPGELAAFVFYAFLVGGSLGALSEVYSDLQRAAGALERLLELLGVAPAIRSGEAPLPAPAAPVPRGRPGASPAATIELRGVDFAYPVRPEVPVLRGVDLRVGAGETVALVGRSGAGKSTLVELLLRFYDPRAGVVRMDGRDVRELSLTAYRCAIGYVPQMPVLFAGTVADNVRLGRPDADPKAVRRALEQAFLLDFVDGLPEGLETPVGELGGRLSGGQRQRLALARAFLRAPRLLLMDEATSALDSESERRIQEVLRASAGSVTTVIVAHRLSTVRLADRILLLDEGRIVADGTHEALLRASALYRELAAGGSAEGEGAEPSLLSL